MGDIGGISQAAASNVNTALTDQTNLEMQNRANTFNAQQAGIQRDWSAQQAQKQMDFNASQSQLQRNFADTEQTKAEAYNTEMSNTAVQRRSADIKAAGFNPLLAVSQLGGASTPTMGAPSGSAASAGLPSGASAQAAGVARAQPWDISGATLALTNAQAANVKADTANKSSQNKILESQADQWAVDTSPEMLFKRTQALSQQYDMDYAKASEVNAVVDQIRNAAQQGDADVAFANIRNQIARMDEQQQRATLSSTISMQNAVNAQQTQEAKNVTDAQSGLLGKTIAYAQAILTPVSSAAGAGKNIASGAKDLVGWGGAIP